MYCITSSFIKLQKKNNNKQMPRNNISATFAATTDATKQPQCRQKSELTLLLCGGRFAVFTKKMESSFIIPTICLNLLLISTCFELFSKRKVTSLLN